MSELELHLPATATMASQELAPLADGQLQRLVAAFLVGSDVDTRAAYARDLSDWLAFCSRHGIEPQALIAPTSTPTPGSSRRSGTGPGPP